MERRRRNLQGVEPVSMAFAPTSAVRLPFQQSLEQACGSNPSSACRIVWQLFQQSPGAVLAQVVGWAGKILLILAIALVLRQVAHRLINRLTRRAAESRLPEKVRKNAQTIFRGTPALLTERRTQRAETMGSVLRHAASIVILGTAALMVLAEFRLNLAPLLASAGIVGVAVGFGAQNLVKDFLSGLFMLFEDQYGVGDVVDTGMAKGTVEEVTLRMTRLRDVNGVVWYVRNGEIARIGNESQGNVTDTS